MADKEIRAHALLSASGASRWLNCTPSPRLEERYGIKPTSKYADEGTLAHAVGELMLRRDLTNEISDMEYERKLEELMNNDSFNDEMFDEVPKYVDYCLEAFNAARVITNDAIALIEEKIDLTEFIPDGFGSCDNIIIADGTMEVTDLKYGKGVPVYAIENKQLMLYGLGALLKYGILYDITTVRLSVIQPRIDNFSSWEISAQELLEWANTELREKAKLAFEGLGDLQVGDWCKFCSVKNRCRLLAEENLKVAKYDFAKPEILTDEEIADILTRAPKLAEWAGSIHEYAQFQAIANNKQWPGYKVVESRANRKWLDEETAINTIYAKFPSLEENDVVTSKIKGIGAIEKLVGKTAFAEKLNSIVIKPAGSPVLVPLTDKRSPISGQAKNDFAE